MSADTITFEECQLHIRHHKLDAYVSGSFTADDGTITEIVVDARPYLRDTWSAGFGELGGMIPELRRRFAEEIEATREPTSDDEHRLTVRELV